MPRIPVHIFVGDPATGNAISGVSATVKNRVTATNATLYSAETGGSTVTNPLTTDSNGRALAYTERAPLQIDYSGTGITAFSEYRDAVIEIVTGLPGSPYDGQEIYFQSSGMATLGVAWHLRYRAGASGSYKWEYLGGGDLYSAVSSGGGPSSITSATWSNAPTTQCEVTLPLAGDYRVQAQTIVNTAVSGVLIAGVAVGAGGSPPVSLQNACQASASGYQSGVIIGQTIGRSASDLLRVRYYHSSTGNITVTGTNLLVTPIRVG